MIFLTPAMTQEERAEERKHFASLPESEQLQSFREFSGFFEYNLRSLQPIMIGAAYDANGTHWEEVEIIINSRFRHQGVRYLSNGTFAINYDALVSILEDCWGSSIDMSDYV